MAFPISGYPLCKPLGRAWKLFFFHNPKVFCIACWAAVFLKRQPFFLFSYMFLCMLYLPNIIPSLPTLFLEELKTQMNWDHIVLDIKCNGKEMLIWDYVHMNHIRYLLQKIIPSLVFTIKNNPSRTVLEVSWTWWNPSFQAALSGIHCCSTERFVVFKCGFDKDFAWIIFFFSSHTTYFKLDKICLLQLVSISFSSPWFLYVCC